MNSFRFAIVGLVLILVGGCGEEDKTAAPPNGTTETPPASVTGKRVPVPPAKQAPAPETAKAPPPAKAPEAGGEKMAPTPATTTRATELKEKPFVDAKTLRQLPAQASVTIVDRSGGWLRVAADGQQGWVRLLHVSSQSLDARSASELESIAKIATGRSGGGNIVSTTGIRGLSEEQLATAQPNTEELKSLERYSVSQEQASEYARRHGLERRQVAHLPKPG